MPKRRRTPKQKAASRKNLEKARRTRYSGKAEALSKHRATLKTRATYTRPSPNPAFGAKVVAARKFLKHHGLKRENIAGTKVTKGITDKHGKKFYAAKRHHGPGRGH